MLDPFMIAIDLLMKTEEKLTISHHPGCCALRILLGCVGGRVMSGRVIIGGVGCSLAKLTIQWTNAFIYNSNCLAFVISRGKCPFEDFNWRQVAAMVQSVSFVVE